MRQRRPPGSDPCSALRFTPPPLLPPSQRKRTLAREHNTLRLKKTPFLAWHVREREGERKRSASLRRPTLHCPPDLQAWAASRAAKRKAKRQRHEQMEQLLERLEEKTRRGEAQPAEEPKQRQPGPTRAAPVAHTAGQAPRVASAAAAPPATVAPPATDDADKPKFLKAMEEREARRRRLKEERLARMEAKQREASVRRGRVWLDGTAACFLFQCPQPWSRREL